MPNPFVAQRQAAGKRYAAAVSDLHAALVELAALDALAPSGTPADSLNSFAASQPESLPELRHREFVPSVPTKIRAAVTARRAELRANLAEAT